MNKYTGVEKFNPKSFQLGSSVGFINLSTVTNELFIRSDENAQRTVRCQSSE